MEMVRTPPPRSLQCLAAPGENRPSALTTGTPVAGASGAGGPFTLGAAAGFPPQTRDFRRAQMQAGLLGEQRLKYGDGCGTWGLSASRCVPWGGEVE